MAASRFADWVAAEREKRGLTQQEFGRLAGLNHSVISRTENGDRVTARTVYRLASAFGLPLEKAAEWSGVPLSALHAEARKEPVLGPGEDPVVLIQRGLVLGRWPEPIRDSILRLVEATRPEASSAELTPAPPTVVPSRPRALPSKLAVGDAEDYTALLADCGWEPETIALFQDLAEFVSERFGTEGRRRLRELLEDPPLVAAAPDSDDPRQIKLGNERALLYVLAEMLGVPWRPRRDPDG